MEYIKDSKKEIINNFNRISKIKKLFIEERENLMLNILDRNSIIKAMQSDDEKESKLAQDLFEHFMRILAKSVYKIEYQTASKLSLSDRLSENDFINKFISLSYNDKHLTTRKALEVILLEEQTENKK